MLHYGMENATRLKEIVSHIRERAWFDHDCWGASGDVEPESLEESRVEVGVWSVWS